MLQKTEIHDVNGFIVTHFILYYTISGQPLKSWRNTHERISVVTSLKSQKFEGRCLAHICTEKITPHFYTNSFNCSTARSIRSPYVHTYPNTRKSYTTYGINGRTRAEIEINHNHYYSNTGYSTCIVWLFKQKNSVTPRNHPARSSIWRFHPYLLYFHPQTCLNAMRSSIIPLIIPSLSLYHRQTVNKNEKNCQHNKPTHPWTHASAYLRLPFCFTQIL